VVSAAHVALDSADLHVHRYRGAMKLSRVHFQIAVGTYHVDTHVSMDGAPTAPPVDVYAIAIFAQTITQIAYSTLRRTRPAWLMSSYVALSPYVAPHADHQLSLCVRHLCCCMRESICIPIQRSRSPQTLHTLSSLDTVFTQRLTSTHVSARRLCTHAAAGVSVSESPLGATIRLPAWLLKAKRSSPGRDELSESAPRRAARTTDAGWMRAPACSL
jgi:hypothetical protein